jgi:superfamily II DNA/RNA helicase
MDAKKSNIHVNDHKHNDGNKTEGISSISAADSIIFAVAGISLNYDFKALPVHVNTQNAIATMGFTRMTEIQAQAFPALLTGVDLLGAAKTGKH